MIYYWTNQKHAFCFQIKNQIKQLNFKSKNTKFVFVFFKFFSIIISGEFYFTRFTHFFLFIFSFCFFASRGEIPPHFIITHFTPFIFRFNTLSFYPFTLLKYPKHSEFSDNSHDYIYALFCILMHQTYVPNACSFTIYFL